jgi:Ribonuclease G/E
MPNAITDRRAAPRYTLILLAEVTDVVSSTKFTARTSDLSRTGCYLDMLNPLPRGTKIQIRLQREKETLELPGTVIYVSPGLGIGVAFAENLSENQTAVLDRWLAAAAKANP